MSRSKSQSLEALRKEAKFLHRALLHGTPDEQRQAAEAFLSFRTYRGKSSLHVLQDASRGKLKRKHAFLAIAKRAGFEDWDEFLAEVFDNSFLDLCVRSVKGSGAKNVYIAILPIEDPYGEEPTTYHLEVELPWYEIQGNYDTGRFDLDRARTLADELERRLNEVGIRVYASRDDWEYVLGSDVYAPEADLMDVLFQEDLSEMDEARSNPDLRVLTGSRSIGGEEVEIAVELSEKSVRFVAFHPKLTSLKEILGEEWDDRDQVDADGRLIVHCPAPYATTFDAHMEHLWELLDEALL